MSAPNTTPPPGPWLPRQGQTTLKCLNQLSCIAHVTVIYPRIFEISITFPLAEVLFPAACHASTQQLLYLELFLTINLNALLNLNITYNLLQLTHVKDIMNIPRGRNLQPVSNTTNTPNNIIRPTPQCSKLPRSNSQRQVLSGQPHTLTHFKRQVPTMAVREAGHAVL